MKWKSKMYTRIKEKEFIAIIREEYKRAKKIVKPLLNGVNFSFVKFYWHRANSSHIGICFPHHKYIGMSEKFRDESSSVKYSEHQFRLTLRHEIAHLATPGQRHKTKFLNVLKELEGNRHSFEEAYQLRWSKKKKNV